LKAEIIRLFIQQVAVIIIIPPVRLEHIDYAV